MVLLRLSTEKGIGGIDPRYLAVAQTLVLQGSGKKCPKPLPVCLTPRELSLVWHVDVVPPLPCATMNSARCQHRDISHTLLLVSYKPILVALFSTQIVYPRNMYLYPHNDHPLNQRYPYLCLNPP